MFGASADAGVNVIRRLPSESAIEPGMGWPCANTWTPAAPRIVFTASSNCTTIGTFNGTFVSPSAGLVPTMCGPCASAKNDVENENEYDWSRLPAESLMSVFR